MSISDTGMDRKFNLKSLIFMAICCDMGIVAKKLISPGAKIVTEYLHIPGGISTTVSLMFIVIGAVLCGFFGSATLMCLVQSVIALVIGTTGSLGMLAIVAYLVPGIVTDILLFLWRRFPLKYNLVEIALTNALAGVSAALCSNILTFRIGGVLLWLYLTVAFVTGIIFGSLAYVLVSRLKRIIK